jgi:23S rRNA pseudouridine2605 synthase
VKKAPRASPDRAGSSENPAGELANSEFIDPEADAQDASSDAMPARVRLNKYLADHGIASRRKCDELIAAGQVTIDGQVTTELGQSIDPTRHTVEIDGFILKPQGLRRRYYLLNKPSGVVCTNEPRETRPRAVDLITDARKGRIYTVGRLDEESKGLILLTNDGDFANRIMHPRYGVEKTYLVRVAGKIDDDALTKIREGVHLSEGRTAGARILVNKRLRDQSTLTLTIREGMNREIRRSFAHVGYKVLDLRRIRIGPLSERGIKIGRWRELTQAEIEALLAGHNESLEIRDDPAREAGARAGRRPRGPGRGGTSRGDRGGRGHGDRGHSAARRPKVRSGWRAFEERVRTRGEPQPFARHTARGPRPESGGYARGGGNERDARRHGRPGADAHKSAGDRRPSNSGARGGPPAKRPPFAKRSGEKRPGDRRPGARRTGKPATRGANRRA